MTADSPETTAPEPVWPMLVTVVALGSLPYVSLLAANAGEMLELDRIATWWIVTLALALLIVALAARVGPATARWVGALVGVALYLSFNFPALAGLREAVGVPWSDLTWWTVVSLSVIVAAVPLVRTPFGQRLLALVAPALLLVPATQLAATGLTAGDPGRPPSADPAVTLEHTPNVYWFVLDGLAGPPFLRDEVGLDPGPFIEHLDRQGFRVLEDARSNYPFTHLAVGSALDMDYLYHGVDEPASPDPYYHRLQGYNRTVDIFEANGYGYVHAYPGLWSASRCSGREDVCFGDHGSLSGTEWALLSVTPLIDLLVDEGTHANIARANDPLHLTEGVLSSAVEPPHFAFIHLLNPHPPYLRDADCGIRQVPLEFAAWGDGSEYADAVTCLFDRLASSVDRILEADDDPVIILQGDHGPRLGLSSSSSGQVLLGDEMHFSALTAIRLPAPCADLDVPEDLTLVNTFRIVFACLQDQPPDLLPDRTFPILRDY